MSATTFIQCTASYSMLTSIYVLVFNNIHMLLREAANFRLVWNLQLFLHIKFLAASADKLAAARLLHPPSGGSGVVHSTPFFLPKIHLHSRFRLLNTFNSFTPSQQLRDRRPKSQRIRPLRASFGL